MVRQMMVCTTIVHQVKRRERKLTFIPYYAWANRNEGEMTVWVND